MEILHPAHEGETHRGVQTEGVPIDPLASRAAKDILKIFDGLSIDSSEMRFLKIPVVSAYIQGMQVQPDIKNINFDALKDQVHLAMARKLALRQLLGGKEPVLPFVW